MTPEHLAKEAQRLLQDEVLLAAIAEAQKDALGQLLTVKADDTVEIQRLQASALAFHEILSVLEGYVLRMANQGEQGIA